MKTPTLTCRVDRRRDEVRRSERWNGLDYVEVDDDQRTLCAHFLDKAPTHLRPENVQIRGGERIRDIRVTGISIRRHKDPTIDDCLEVAVDRPGDFSTYRLCLVEVDDEGRPTNRPLRGFDPRYSCVEFSFKAGCPTDLDCAVERGCSPLLPQEPALDYLAKDYESFRQLILDRLALVMPDWHERHVPDLGVTLVELLAYVGDHLSYFQDAVATEAYLDRARQRISVRRHARLVDYTMHDGCNARAWVHVWTDTELTVKPSELAFVAGTDLVFEPLAERSEPTIVLRPAHNRMDFYTWGDHECCLPEGATSAVLRDGWVPLAPPEPEDPYYERQEPATPPERRLQLRAGDVLIFEEVLSPMTGEAPDADPAHRHAVRLTSVVNDVDRLFTEPVAGYDEELPVPVVKVTWDEDDALPFSLCISAVGPPPECSLIEGVSVALGNVVLVDHGRTLDVEELGEVQAADAVAKCEAEGLAAESVLASRRFAPVLAHGPLTFAQALDRRVAAPAAAALSQDARRALPSVVLTGTPELLSPGVDPLWEARRDLLSSGSRDQHFVVEVDDDALAHVRFGDGDCGSAPPAGMAYSAVYRVGNGRVGNVGAETITTVVDRGGVLSGVEFRARNPMPAQGGMEPEGALHVKQFAPHRFRSELARAVTADDYAALVERELAPVQRAAAALRWTGSWYEVQVAVDARGAPVPDAGLLRSVRHALHPYRRIGHDLRALPALEVALDLELTVCVSPHFLRGHVKAALLEVLGTGTRRDGGHGFFHPDNLTFGEGIFVSSLVAVAQAVEGVRSVEVTRLERLFEGPNHEVETGVLLLGEAEVARLDNDPSFPEHGRLNLVMRGGR